MANRTMTLSLDEDDYNAIQAEIARYQAVHRWPDAEGGVMLPEGESCLAGAILAECCRDLADYRDLFLASRGPDGSAGPGEG